MKHQNTDHLQKETQKQRGQTTYTLLNQVANIFIYLCVYVARNNQLTLMKIVSPDMKFRQKAMIIDRGSNATHPKPISRWSD